jgi:ComF family protein
MVLPPVVSAPITSFQAPFLYKGPLREAILRFKFKDVVEFAPVLARLMLPHIPLHNDALLVAVPSHPKRLRQRLYNPSVLLVREIARQTGLSFNPTALKRLQHDAPQNRKTRAQRLALPGSHFSASPAVQGKTIILVDDIFTTGATAKACALALTRAGAVQVHVRTLAYTAPE